MNVHYHTLHAEDPQERYVEDLSSDMEAMDDDEALTKIAAYCGYTSEDPGENIISLIEEHKDTLIQPGICIFCGHVTMIDADAEDEICSFCDLNGVQSLNTLLDITSEE